ncbi:hypothetical protein FH972_017016 [Carpinus fangiana]|uniref:Micro-fibrillar-associated protein 1 C-terminal domain-containing protein n=1 Tax=Carpinus fangiana TaxID=176857 RepID=A0A5N6RI67_9ROSI|nr:hypothetical protein FH972_017016 [Carpinus fangiana]
MSVTAGVSDTIIAIRDKLRGKIGQTKVKRYWPGRAPEWADDAHEDGDIQLDRLAALEQAFPRQDNSHIVKKDDARLRRLAESKIDNREEVRADHRRIRQAEIVSTIEEEARRQERFMQKYYHKGAFFQADADDHAATAGTDGIFTRDFSAPTGEDKMDKTILPKVMQVKHFGRSGRTKWTHLVNEDTTDWNNPWTYNDPLRAKYNAKMAGMNADISKPKGSKKLKDWESR